MVVVTLKNKKNLKLLLLITFKNESNGIVKIFVNLFNLYSQTLQYYSFKNVDVFTRLRSIRILSNSS